MERSVLISTPLGRAIVRCGWGPLAKACGVTQQAVRKWLAYGRMPQSEFSGLTDYAGAIQRVTDGDVTKKELLAWSRKGWTSTAA